MSNTLLRDISRLHQQKADLLDEKKRIEENLSSIEPQIQKVQQYLLNAICLHPTYEELRVNNDNKYGGWGEYRCTTCGHRKQESW